MDCPLCGYDNLEGAEDCDSCGGDLRAESYESSDAPGRLQSAVLGNLADVGVIAPLLLRSEDTVQAAVDLMRGERQGSVLVVDEDRLTGIFSERDLLSRVDPDSDLSSISLGSVMTGPPRAYRLEHNLAFAMNGQTLREHRHLPMVDENGALLGFISIRGILSHIRRKAGL